MPVKRWLGPVVLGVVLLASCRDATQVGVVLRSNVAYASGMNVGLWASHSGAEATPVVQSSEPWLGDGELGDVYVVPGAAGKDAPLTPRVALGLRGKPASACLNASDASGCIVAKRTLAFVPHTRLKVPIVLYAACEGVRCSDDTTCSYLGTCVPASVDPAACASPEGCPLPGEPPFVPGAAQPNIDAGPKDAIGQDTGPQPPAFVLASGGAHMCARFEDGTVKCWGSNVSGQLGQGDLQNRGAKPGELGSNLPFVDLGPGRTALDVQCGAGHTCARLDNGAVKCWGRNVSGLLGLGDTNNRGDGPGEMGVNLPAIDLGPGRTALQLSPGASHTCARLDDGSVKCWGANFSGQLGLGDTIDRGDGPAELGTSLPSVDLGPGRTALQVVAGAGHTCARLDNGAVKCWGRNFEGQLGLGDRQNRGDAPGEMGGSLPFVDLGPGRTALQISSADLHVCAVLDNRSIKCWGVNTQGRLGLGDPQDRGGGPLQMGSSLPFVDLGPGRTALEVAAGTQHSCARLDNGSIKCWGFNFFGEVGLGDTQPRGDAPLEMGANLPSIDFGPGLTAIALVAGSNHNCAHLGNGSVKCWGRNLEGQLGLGDAQNRGDGSGEMGTTLPAVELR
jgi:alpha-tubulin suppressor-like RCC1 family protein